jgi:hypothetical protein
VDLDQIGVVEPHQVAHAAGGFELYYQSMVESATNLVIAVENRLPTALVSAGG